MWVIHVEMVGVSSNVSLSAHRHEYNEHVGARRFAAERRGTKLVSQITTFKICALETGLLEDGMFSKVRRDLLTFSTTSRRSF